MSTTKLGRNDLCPKCGKKMKKCQCGGGVKKLGIYRVPAWLFYSAIIMITAIGGWWWGTKRSEENRTAAIVAWGEYFRSRPADSWWLDAPPKGNELPGVATKLSARQQRVLALLKKYKNVSPLATQIYQEFPKFKTSVFTRGISMMVELTATPDLQGLELCFIPANEAAGPQARHPSTVYYKREWRAVMCYAVDLPESLFASVLFHELTHALCHKHNLPSSRAPEASDIFMKEEVRAHGVGLAVLDAATDGQFMAAVDAIVARHEKNASYKEIITALTPNDLLELGRRLNWEMTVSTAALVQMDFFFGIGWRVIQRRAGNNEEKIRSQCIELYRWLLQWGKAH